MSSPQLHPQPVDYLLRKLASERARRVALSRECAELRRTIRRLRESRDHWREEAQNWKWGALRR